MKIKNKLYGHSLKDDTSYLDKMYHLTAIRCYIFRRTLVYVTNLVSFPVSVDSFLFH